MRRALMLAICGVSLSACTSSNLLQLESKPATVSLALESQPPGAEAKLASGASCTTPCTLPVTAAAGGVAVTYSLPGYKTQTVQVDVVPSATAAEGPRLEPNPALVELEQAPAPQQ